MRMNCGEEHRCRHACNSHVCHRNDPSRARLVVNSRELSKKFTGIDLAQQDLTAGDRLQFHTNSSVDDAENVAACVLIIDNPLVTGCATPGALSIETVDFCRIQRPE